MESRRLPSTPADEAADRDSQIEALLVDGLDRYFSGRYEDAIHLWTRVLFLDRSHARARAYIDRARTALGERQRRSEEMLQASRELLDQGQTDAARRLLTEAVAASGDDEHAAALRVRLERMERAHVPVPAGWSATPAAGEEAVPGWSWPRRSPTTLGTTAIVAAVIVLVIGLFSVTWQNWMGLGETETSIRPATVKVPVLSSSEVALVRANTLFNRGRLAEALQALDRVGPDSPDRPAADQLRVEIQQLLLASVRPPSSGQPATPIRR